MVDMTLEVVAWTLQQFWGPPTLEWCQANGLRDSSCVFEGARGVQARFRGVQGLPQQPRGVFSFALVADVLSGSKAGLGPGLGMGADGEGISAGGSGGSGVGPSPMSTLHSQVNKGKHKAVSESEVPKHMHRWLSLAPIVFEGGPLGSHIFSLGSGQPLPSIMVHQGVLEGSHLEVARLWMEVEGLRKKVQLARQERDKTA
ncbi:hypothetical protein C0992_002548 [Termitomyces sp. T32_za158]|nr:hypothetical protein C0992_002548 [Termitomyces sp. T32_za158]